MGMSHRAAAGLTLLLGVAGALVSFLAMLGLGSATGARDCAGLAPRVCDGWELLGFLPGAGWVIGLVVALAGIQLSGRGRRPGPFVVTGWAIAAVAVLVTYFLARPV